MEVKLFDSCGPHFFAGDAGEPGGSRQRLVDHVANIFGVANPLVESCSFTKQYWGRVWTLLTEKNPIYRQISALFFDGYLHGISYPNWFHIHLHKLFSSFISQFIAGYPRETSFFAQQIVCDGENIHRGRGIAMEHITNPFFFHDHKPHRSNRLRGIVWNIFT